MRSVLALPGKCPVQFKRVCFSGPTINAFELGRQAWGIGLGALGLSPLCFAISCKSQDRANIVHRTFAKGVTCGLMRRPWPARLKSHCWGKKQKTIRADRAPDSAEIR